MKKLGFTLSELIIALGLIGVIAAITAPAISNLLPDKNKALVLKYHKIISDINNNLINNPGIYWQPADADCEGLACTQQPVAPPYDSDIKYSGSNKYPNLLKDNLDVAVDNSDSATIKFMTKDGSEWLLDGGSAAEASFNIIIDFNGSDKGKNCYYSSSCKKPDSCNFKVDQAGKVSGDDSLTKAYLANPYKINDKKNDFEAAKNMS